MANKEAPVKKLLSKIWSGLKTFMEILAYIADGEMEYARSQRACPKCGHVRQLPTGCGPF